MMNGMAQTNKDWMIKVDGKCRLFLKRKKYDVVEYTPYEYTQDNITYVSNLIRDNLSNRFLTIPPSHRRGHNPFFGLCVPATFTLFYLMDTDLLEPMRGQDYDDEWHWWLRDINTEQRYDLTAEQFPNQDELEKIYNSGKPSRFYGRPNGMPQKRFLDLLQCVQPHSGRWTTDNPSYTPAITLPM